ncbi:MAG TPA: DNA mismatch repair endonuclease MutL [Kofleriaceae bacterium]|jgi:DNA mismatch repair protein MutL
MGASIAVLPPHVIDQIAAGEVIERPASVVKELVDNAIDAGAGLVVVEVSGGGRSLVRVTDDGAGMARDEALLSLERHATSKLRAVDDLWGLSTLGFRGEALPSIASVSKLTLTTRRAEDLAATRIVVEGGRVISVSDVGAPRGTTVEVADLLWNVPARLKFLKGEATEAAHVTELVARIAMAYPALHVRLRQNGRTALELPPDRDGLSRAQALLGPRIASRLHSVHGEESGVRVTTFLGAPELAQTTTRGVQLFVGHRPIRDRGVLHALCMGYGELLPRGRYPVAVVLLDLAGGAVDVNVHPQKAEVRFADPSSVAAAVRHVVQDGIVAARWRDESSGAAPVQMIASVAPPALPFDAPATPLADRFAKDLTPQGTLGFDPPAPRASAAPPVKYGTRGADSSSASPRDWVRAVRDANRAARVVEEPPAMWEGRPIVPSDPRAVAESRATLPTAADSPAATPGFFASLRFLGQLDLTYLVCETSGELVLVDQHAAHERVELHRLRLHHTESRPAVQKLLFPSTLDASPPQLELVSRLADVLATVGYEVEPFGKSTLAVKAVPAGIRHGDPAHVLRALLAEWAEDGAPSDAERIDALLGRIACHSVVRSGDRLSPSEAESLLRNLDGVDLTLPAPHGRAVLLRLPLSEIGRRFGR